MMRRQQHTQAIRLGVLHGHPSGAAAAARAPASGPAAADEREMRQVFPLAPSPPDSRPAKLPGPARAPVPVADDLEVAKPRRGEGLGALVRRPPRGRFPSRSLGPTDPKRSEARRRYRAPRPDETAYRRQALAVRGPAMPRPVACRRVSTSASQDLATATVDRVLRHAHVVDTPARPAAGPAGTPTVRKRRDVLGQLMRGDRAAAPRIRQGGRVGEPLSAAPAPCGPHTQWRR